MNKQSGFTLIELVVVIVILGILAVTAAPKFMNLQDDAAEATTHGLKGAMESAVEIVHAKAIIQGVENETDAEIEMENGDIVKTRYGYPYADPTGIFLTVSGLDDAEYAAAGAPFDSEWVYDVGEESVSFALAQRASQLVDYDECNVYYHAPVGKGDEPTIEFKSCIN